MVLPARSNCSSTPSSPNSRTWSSRTACPSNSSKACILWRLPLYAQRMTAHNAHISGPPTDLAGAVLTVDLDAIQENWKRLRAKAGKAECGAAVKGNGYGLGVEHVAPALWAA